MKDYAVQELDDLRRVCRFRLLYGKNKSGWSREYQEHQLIVAVEEMVRTHMMAGHIAQDILDADKETNG